MPRNRLALVGFVTLLGCIAVVAATQVRAQTMPRATGNGAFYVKCPFSHRAADDAIVFPGEPGRSHLHDFLANKSTNAFSTNESLRAATTTCKRPADRSAYWIPTLYLDSAPIAPIEATANYNGGIRDVASIQPFPEGFRMIAGDSKATERQVGGHVVDWTCEPHKMVAEGKSPQGSPRAQAFRAVIAKLDRLIARKRLKVSKLRRAIKHRRIALKRQRARGGSTLSGRRVLVRRIRAYRKQRRALRRARFERANRVAALDAYLNGGGTSIPTCAKGTPLVLDVRFGDCWDGAHLDSADHKSHVAYSRYSKADNKWVCPSTHPVLLPKLRLRVEYPITGGPDVRLSPGDVDAGHADFMNGWDQGKLAELVRTCLNADKNCGNGDVPMNDGTPSPAPVPSPAPTPSPSPSPQPEPEPDPNPLPPLPPLP